MRSQGQKTDPYTMKTLVGQRRTPVADQRQPARAGTPPEHSAIQRSLNVTTFISASRRSCRNCTFRFVSSKRSTLIQELDVTPEVAELAMRLATRTVRHPKDALFIAHVAHDGPIAGT
jgi:hypothetical protein